MKTVSLILIAVFSSCAFAKGGDWPEFRYLGQCVSTNDEMSATLKLYSQELKADKAVNGFISVTLSKRARSEEFGAYGADFELLADQSGVKVTYGAGDSIEIPFGKDIKVPDKDGNYAVCDTAKNGKH